MNWRRGMILAGIHVGIAIVLTASELIPRSKTARCAQPSLVLAVYQEEGETVTFTTSCNLWRSIPFSERVLIISELPAVILSGWGEICPARWTTAGLIGIDDSHHSFAQQTGSAVALCGLIAIQWLLLGGMPLAKARKWWLEPGACNTASTCVGLGLFLFGLALMRLTGIENAAAVFGLLAAPFLLLAFFTWIAWPVLVIERTTRFAWRLTTKNRKPSHPRPDSTRIGEQP